VSLLDAERLVRALMRAPGWRSVAGAIRALGGPFIPPFRVPPVEPGRADRPLDAFMRSCAGGFVAGAATVDITPTRPVGANLAGFGPERSCAGLRDPLYARALVLSDGRVPLVIVTLDLIGLSLARIRRIRALLTERYPDGVLLVCTHNHQGPDTMGLWGRALLGSIPVRTGVDPAYLAQLERGVVEAVSKACTNAQPARLHLAAGIFDREGRWVHNERGPVRDPLLRVMHLTGLRGEPIASLAQYACHPETLWEHNLQMSADFCAVCCKTMERSLGGVGLYANGALGAMVTAALPHDSPRDARDRTVDELGIAIGRAAVRLARRGLDDPITAARIRTDRSEVVLPPDENALYLLMLALGVVEERDLKNGLVTEVSLFRIGPASLVGLPGEPAPALGLELLERIPGQPKFLLGLANDELGYLLPPEYFHDPAYSYEQTMTPGAQTALRLALGLERLAARVEGDAGSDD